MVRIEFECPGDDVLLCDEELWFFVLNHWYIPQSGADGEDFEASFPDRPRPVYTAIKHVDEQFQITVRRSWDRVFDLTWYNPHLTPRPDKKSIIGWVWEIRWKWVIAETPFIGAVTN